MTDLERKVGVVREAPEPLLRALRVIDPTAELLYLGNGRWMLGQVIPDCRIVKAGWMQLEANKGAAGKLEQMRLTGRLHGKRLVEALHEIRSRRIVAEARRLGFRPTAEYTFRGEPNGSIVRDQELMDFLWRHMSMNETSQLEAQDGEDRRAQALADAQDEHKARDAWRYAFTRSHAVTRHDDPTVQRVRSGFTRVQPSTLVS